MRAAGQPVQQVAEVHVGVLTQRDAVRKADAAPGRPVEHGGDQRAGLRHEGQGAGAGVHVREAGVQADVRRQQAQAVGPQDAQQVAPGGIEHGRLGGSVQPGGQHHGGARAAHAQGLDQPRYAGRWGADHGQVRRLRQGRHVGKADVVPQTLAPGVHRPARAREGRLPDVAPDGGPHAAGAVGRAEDGHAAGGEKLVEVTDGHGLADTVRGEAESGQGRAGQGVGLVCAARVSRSSVPLHGFTKMTKACLAPGQSGPVRSRYGVGFARPVHRCPIFPATT